MTLGGLRRSRQIPPPRRYRVVLDSVRRFPTIFSKMMPIDRKKDRVPVLALRLMYCSQRTYVGSSDMKHIDDPDAVINEDNANFIFLLTL